MKPVATRFDGQSPQALMRGVTHTDGAVRLEAVREVGSRGVASEGFYERLLLVAQHDPEPTVRTAAVSALGELAHAGVRVLDRLRVARKRAVYPESARLAYIFERVECSIGRLP